MIETNTAVTSAINNCNLEIEIFQEQFQILTQIVETINNELLIDQPKLIVIKLPSVADIIASTDAMLVDLGNFSDLIIQRGKDILLLADQAQQFICVSNDAFDRVIDTWNWLTSQDMGSTIISETSILKTEIFDLVLNINNRRELISNEELIITQALLDNAIGNFQSIIDTIISTIININLIFKKSLTVTNVFKNVLAVNTTVGIALAVTKRSWDIMIRMNQHNYRTTTTVLDQQNLSATSRTLSANSLYPISMVDREKQINSWMNKMLIVSGLDTKIEISGKIYKFTNKKDLVYNPEQLPSNYSTLTTPQIVETYNTSQQSQIVPDILQDIISDAGLVTTIGSITSSALTNWYQAQSAPSYSLQELINESVTPEFVSWYNKYLNTYVIQETIKNILNKKQKLQMRNILYEYGITSNYPIESEIFNTSKYNLNTNILIDGTNAQIAFQQFLNDEITRVMNSQEHLESVASIKNLYRNVLIPETNSGTFTLAMYYKDANGEEVLEKVMEQFKYSYLLYKDDLKIHYLEAKVNKLDYFLIKDNTMIVNYTYTEDLIKTLTFVETSIHQVELSIKYNGYLVDFDYLAPEYDIEYMKVLVDGVVEDKQNGIKKILKTTYNNSLDPNGLNIITSSKEETHLETHWVTDNIIERITIDITNIYRTELLKGNMDFTQARVNSIIGALRFLGYREKLDEYIDDTWLYGVPRYVAQPE